MRQKITDLWSKYRSEICAVIGILLLYLFFFAVGITCPIKFLTGVSCPGCGMSRACLHAAKLDFRSAFAYHPMWITIPFVAFFLVLFKWKKKKTAFNITLYTFALLMIGVYIYRMFFLPQDIVVFSPNKSAFAKAFQYLKSLIS